MKNLTTLFYDTDNANSLLDAITLGKRKTRQLLSARQEIRTRLEKYLPKLLNEQVTDHSIEGIGLFPEPRFFTQGSFASKTVNAPCRAPQQADLDDGLYLPYSTLEDSPPEQMSEILFDAVAQVMTDMANLEQHHKWTVNTDNGNCVRMEIDVDMHIDVPIYSIPDKEFHLLEDSMDAARAKLAEMNESMAILKSTAGMESYAVMDSLSMNSEELRDYMEHQEAYADALAEEVGQIWEEMPTEKVLMASRDNGWQSKDPRPILEWFNYQVQAKGDQLTRVVRYVKSWRDFQHWTVDDPKSILLMVAVNECFRASHFAGSEVRDDLALLDVLERLPEVLSGKLINPSMPNEEEDLAARLDNKNIRQDVIQRLKKFGSDLSSAINNKGRPEDSINLIRNHLGDRFPMAPRKPLNLAVSGAVAAIASDTAAAYPKGSVVHA